MDEVKFLQIEPTTRCNYTCKFCSGRHLAQGDLELNKFHSIIADFPDLQHILLQGEGEPFLNSDFFKMLELAKTKQIKVFTVTNGSMFTPKIINKIIECQLDAINISIEWSTNQEFHEFRGGNLDQVKNGIKALIATRNNLNLNYPVVGLSVTILKDTVCLFNSIINLYRELGLDGGIQYQFLNSKDTYTTNYDAYLKSQILTGDEEKNFKEYYAEALMEINRNRLHLNFYEEMPEVQNIESNTLKGYDKSCELIENSLYIDFNGHVTPCCMVKDIQKYSMGKVGETSFNSLNAKRKKFLNMIRTGIIPEFCNECHRAINIHLHLNKIADYKPKVNVQYLQETTYSKHLNNAFYNLIFKLCDGKITCMDIVSQISNIYVIDMSDAKMLILPKIDELLSKKILFI
jgi:radical SAM protein with 4Fe4S-binding SPASM domain